MPPMSPDCLFHLAWHRERLEGDSLVLLLVPKDCSPYAGARKFEAINCNGRLLDPIEAHMSDLASIRREDDTSGSPSMIETRVLLAISERARLAGYVLPRIIPTVAYPHWAKLKLSDEQRNALENRTGNAA